MSAVDFRLPPPKVTRSAVDALVADVAEGIEMLRRPHVAGVALTDEQIMDRARNIVGGLLGNYKFERLPAAEAPLVTAQGQARAEMMTPYYRGKR